MTKTLAFIAALILAFSAFVTVASAGQNASNAQRVGDLTRVKHEDSNVVQQQGLVLGLSGTGDTQSSIPADRLHKLLLQNRSARGITTKDLISKNIAFVMVSATIPPNAKEGDRIDIMVSSATAKSLKGGNLLITYLEGPAQRTKGTYVKDVKRTQYVQGQGQIEIEGANENVGIIKQGGIVLQEIKSSIYDERTQSISLVLNHADTIMADQVVKAINSAREQLLPVGTPASVRLASAIDSKEIVVKVPPEYVARNRLNEFIARVKKVNVTVEEPSGKILINKRLNGIWITGYVTISEAAFSYKNIAIRIPAIRVPGQPVVKQRTIFTLPKPGTPLKNKAKVKEPEPIPSEDPPLSVELQTLVDTLNVLEVKTEDIIAIIEGLHRARAINAKLEYVEG